jgi:Raf kinase inhibitor-like YbhB/YbcL family protein
MYFLIQKSWWPEEVSFMKSRILVLVSLFLLIILLGCTGGPVEQSVSSTQMSGFTLSSGAFAAGKPIPMKYTCDGNDSSVPLQWTEPPQGTKSFVLIMDDPDARGFLHWLLFNMPANARGLAENLPRQATLPDGSRHGKNSWGRTDYGGPCPPSGTHHYNFSLYALDVLLDLPAGASKSDVLKVAQKHILAQAEFSGVYARK